MNTHLRRRTVTAAAATLAIGALLTATSPWAIAAPATASTTPAPTATATAGSDGSDGGRSVVVKDGVVTVTLDPAKVKARCDKAPAAQARIAALVGRIDGGSDVKGSILWLHARAADARAAGRDAAATRFDLRAERRTEREKRLTATAARLTRLQDTICAPLAAQSGAS
jgi:hypothetical protein